MTNETLEKLQISPMEMWFGDKTLLTRHTASILNSRQSKYPTGSEEWIRATHDAAVSVANKDMTLLSGLGMKTWEFAIWATGQALGWIAILVPIPENSSIEVAHRACQKVVTDFELLMSHCCIIPYFESTGNSGKKLWHTRDNWIIEHSDILFPVSIRDKGSLETAISSPAISKKVDPTFKIKYAPRKESFNSPPDPVVSRSLLQDIEWNYMTHWTRISAEPWPGETRYRFYSDLNKSGKKFPRSGFDTLKNILLEKLIRGSSRYIAMKTDMVSFTSLHPSDMIPLMKWRKRYVRPSFEPFGIAIKRSILEKMGAQKVIYGDPDDRKLLPLAKRLYFQPRTSKNAVWSNESEWRIKGDLDLNQIKNDDILLLVPSEETRKELQPLVQYQVVSLA
jgi:hypothetical protein